MFLPVVSVLKREDRNLVKLIPFRRLFQIRQQENKQSRSKFVEIEIKDMLYIRMEGDD